MLKNKIRVSQATASPHIRRAIADVLHSSEPGADEPSTKKCRNRLEIEEIRDQVVDRATQLIVGAVTIGQPNFALGDSCNV